MSEFTAQKPNANLVKVLQNTHGKPKWSTFLKFAQIAVENKIPFGNTVFSLRDALAKEAIRISELDENLAKLQLAKFFRDVNVWLSRAAAQKHKTERRNRGHTRKIKLPISTPNADSKIADLNLLNLDNSIDLIQFGVSSWPSEVTQMGTNAFRLKLETMAMEQPKEFENYVKNIYLRHLLPMVAEPFCKAERLPMLWFWKFTETTIYPGLDFWEDPISPSSLLARRKIQLERNLKVYASKNGLTEYFIAIVNSGYIEKELVSDFQWMFDSLNKAEQSDFFECSQMHSPLEFIEELIQFTEPRSIQRKQAIAERMEHEQKIEATYQEGLRRSAVKPNVSKLSGSFNFTSTKYCPICATAPCAHGGGGHYDNK